MKTTKTAGTSLEALFEAALWGDDTNHNQGWKVHADGFVTPRSDGGAKHTQVRTALLPMTRLAVRAGFNPLHALRLASHSPPQAIRSVIREKPFMGMRKITAVRNPFDLMVSAYFWKTRETPVAPQFADWLVTQERSTVNSQLASFYDDSWEFIRFEDLQETSSAVLTGLGVSAARSVPELKTGHRPDAASDYRDFYDSRSRAYVESLYEDWLREFSYKF